MSRAAAPRGCGYSRIWGSILAAVAAFAFARVDGRAIRAAPADVFSSRGDRHDAGVAISGCAAILTPLTCELSRGSPRTLVIWLPGREAQADTLRITARGLAVEPHQVRSLPGGLRVDLPVQLKAETGQLQLSVAKQSVLHLALRPVASWSWQAERNAAPSAETIARLEPLRARATGAEGSKLLRVLAESHMALGHSERAFQSLEEGAAIASAAGRDSEVRSHWLRTAYHHATAYDFERSQAALDHARDVRSSIIDGDGEAAAAYVSGYLQSLQRNLPAATRAYERARSWVQRGSELMAPQVATASSSIAEQQGRIEDALALLEEAQASPLAKKDPCFRALTMARAGWYELQWRVAEKEASTIERARHRLREAVTIYERQCHKAPQNEPALAVAHLGLAALAARDTRDARVQLERLEGFALSPRLRSWQSLLDAELLLAERKPSEAERAFARLEAGALRFLAWDFAWQARRGAALGALARGELELALKNFDRAVELLSLATAWVSIDAGALRGSQHAAGLVEDHAAALLSAGRVSAAFDVLRRARTRVLTELARDRALPASPVWREALRAYSSARDAVERRAIELELTPRTEKEEAKARLVAAEQLASRASQLVTEQLRRPAMRTELSSVDDDEAILLWTRIHGDWHGFVRVGATVTHWSSPTQPTGQGWLSPFSPELQRVRRLRLLMEGALAGVELQALARRSLPKLSVSYSLDLSGASRSYTLPGATLLAGDTAGDLPHARQELQLIAQNLKEQSHPFEQLVGSELTASRLRAAAIRATRLHYAGHAAFLGAEGWQSRLQVSHGHITPAEILTWSTVPSEVVLSACDAARDTSLLHAQSLGIGQAFLLAGTHAVVAPGRPISDQVARRFSLSLWRRLAAGDSLEAAYQATYGELADGDEAETFRLLGL